MAGGRRYLRKACLGGWKSQQRSAGAFGPTSAGAFPATGIAPNKRVFTCLWRRKGSPSYHDNCNKAKRLVRLVDSMRHDRDFGRILRIGFCRSKQKRRNLETDCEK